MPCVGSCPVGRLQGAKSSCPSLEAAAGRKHKGSLPQSSQVVTSTSHLLSCVPATGFITGIQARPREASEAVPAAHLHQGSPGGINAVELGQLCHPMANICPAPPGSVTESCVGHSADLCRTDWAIPIASMNSYRWSDKAPVWSLQNLYLI